MRVTSKTISKAIEKEFGIPDVKLINGGGYQYFCSDNDLVGEFICSLSSHSHYVFRMSDWTTQDWVNMFKQDIHQTEFTKDSIEVIAELKAAIKNSINKKEIKMIAINSKYQPLVNRFSSWDKKYSEEVNHNHLNNRDDSPKQERAYEKACVLFLELPKREQANIAKQSGEKLSTFGYGV